MNKTVIVALASATLSIGLLAAMPSEAAAAMTSTQPSAAESPFACDALALDPVTRKRHFEVLGPELKGKRLAVQELPDGFEFTFANDQTTYQHLTEWVNGERLCCPFFDISVRAVAEHGPLKMRITGRPGTKDFMRADGAGWVRPIVASK